jgi:peptidoglycan hydrolase-like protein with peptidoglycan-binding domain
VKRVSVVLVLLAAGLAAVTAAGAILRLAPAYASPDAASPASAPRASAPATSTPSATPSATPSGTPTPTPVAPLRVIGLSPAAGARNVAFGKTIKVTFSAQVAATTPYPRLSPSVPGTWKHSGTSALVFTPKGHLPVYTQVRVTIPAGSAGVHGADGGRLAKPYVVRFTVGGPSSVLRLQQLLAELGYLPLRFHPEAASPKKAALLSEPTDADLIALQPVAGRFTWRWDHLPSTLTALWAKGRTTVLLRGAIMAFEAGHGLSADGAAGRKVWTALLAQVAAHKAHEGAYRYLVVTTRLPQKLSVWSNGKVIYTTPANTGIASRPTQKGTFPVYLRFRTTTMSGTNPDGTHYNDPGVPYVAYFNGGDAVHGFLRASYGSPQSLGCVELSYSSAAVVWKYDPLGTLVTVR